MPAVFRVISVVGTVAMLWVGGHLVVVPGARGVDARHDGLGRDLLARAGRLVDVHGAGRGRDDDPPGG
ncbi:DUF808 family protein, partial [Streptomyces niveiscabiei]|uniref:DUF808 family protein n=1 Tax=Streptomyces niveiscabiei TaxID=164115 RepID=UPI0038F65BDC